MENEWDERYNAPIIHWDSLQDIDLGEASTQRIIVNPDSSKGEVIPIQALLLRRDSPDLIVVLHGALDLKTITPPRFEWVRTLADNRSANLLFIADTTLDVSERVNLAWYIGTTSDNLTDRVASFVQRVQSLLGVRRTVIMGSSGGGYASLAIAHRTPHAMALALSPQVTVRDYHEWVYKRLQEAAFPEFASFDEVEAAQLSRFSLLALYKEPSAPGASFLYVQNTGDGSHIEKHYTPFAASMGVPTGGGISADGTRRFILEDWGPGHRGPTGARLHELLDMAFESCPSAKGRHAAPVAL